MMQINEINDEAPNRLNITTKMYDDGIEPNYLEIMMKAWVSDEQSDVSAKIRFAVNHEIKPPKIVVDTVYRDGDDERQTKREWDIHGDTSDDDTLNWMRNDRESVEEFMAARTVINATWLVDGAVDDWGFDA